MGDPSTCNVADQRDAPESVLRFVRDVVALRRQSPDLLAGDYGSMVSPDLSWVWRRGARTVVALNMSDDPTEITLPSPNSRVAVGTDRSRDGFTVKEAIDLQPWEGIVLLESS
jgi:alpha-glucosidase